MKKNKKIGKIFYIIFMTQIIIYYLGGSNLTVKRIGEFYIKQNDKNFIQKPNAFFVDENEQFFIIDKGSFNIKVYNRKGVFIRSFGRKGVGPGEFLSPTLITGINNKIFIYDFKRKKLLYFIRERSNIYFKESSLFPYFISGIKAISDDKLLVSGVMYMIKNKKRIYYSLAFYDIKQRKFRYIIPSCFLYGLKTNKEYSGFLMHKLLNISPAVVGDYNGNEFAQAPVTMFRIVFANMKGNIISRVEGKSSRFIKPEYNRKLEKLIMMRKLKEAANYLSEKSYIEKLFYIDKTKKVVVIFSSFNKKNISKDYFLYVYNKKRKLLYNVKLISGDKGKSLKSLFYYNAKNKILYVLETISSGFSDLKYKISKFKMIDK
jgi:hypothetical protein